MSLKKNSSFIYIIIFLIILCGFLFFIFYRNKSNSNNNEQINSARLAAESNADINILGNSQVQGEVANKINDAITNTETPLAKTEDEISSYSTSLSGSSEGRLTNIRITCNTLNGYTVAPGETFSFCNVVGPSTEEKGYKEAPVIKHRKNNSSIRWW